MKSLVEFIKESCSSSEECVATSKKFSFNFTDFEGAEELIKSVQELNDKDSLDVEIEDSKVSFTVSKEDVDKYDGLMELLQDYVQLRGKDQKRTSDESYAQKVAKCEKTVASYFEYVDDVKAEPEETKKGEEKKEEDKKEEDKKEEE